MFNNLDFIQIYVAKNTENDNLRKTERNLKLVDPRKLDLRQKQIILLSKFGKEKIIFHEKNLKHRKIILLINFIFDPTFFLIASYQILKNHVILISHESFFERKDFPQLHRF